jgi:hypothetical protein
MLARTVSYRSRCAPARSTVCSISVLGGPRHHVLVSAQDERLQAPRQMRAPSAVAVLFDRRAIQLCKAAAVAKKARQQQVELRPQLGQVVFERRAGQRQPVRGAQAPGGFGGARLGVLQVLCLVEDGDVELMLDQFVDVARQERIGGQHHVVAADLGKRRVPAQPVQHQRLQLRRKACALGLPVVHDRGGCQHQRGPLQPPRVFFQQQVGNRLHRLAQTHVVGQDAGQLVLAQELQPRQPGQLIRPQLGAQARRRCHRRDRAERCQPLAQPTQVLGAPPFEAGAGQLDQACGVGACQPQLAGLTGRAIVQLHQRAQDGAQALGRHRQDAPLVQPHVHGLKLAAFCEQRLAQFAVVQQPLQHRQQRHALALDLHAQFELEPALVGLRFGVDEEGAGLDRLPGEVRRQCHDPTGLAPARHGLVHQPQHQRLVQEEAAFMRLLLGRVGHVVKARRVQPVQCLAVHLGVDHGRDQRAVVHARAAGVIQVYRQIAVAHMHEGGGAPDRLLGEAQVMHHRDVGQAQVNHGLLAQRAHRDGGGQRRTRRGHRQRGERGVQLARDLRGLRHLDRRRGQQNLGQRGVDVGRHRAELAALRVQIPQAVEH